MTKNTKQQNRMELPDHLRGFAVLTMILIHVLNEYGSHHLYESKIFPVIDFLAGPPAAPVFMALMGFFFFMKNPSLSHGLKRGGLLILSGYLLNLLKGWLPVMLAQKFWGFPRDYFPELFSSYYLAFNVEILILAGLSFLLMSLVNSFTRSPLPLALSALVIMAVSPLLWGLGESVPILKHPVRPLWGADTDFTIFPLFPWGAYALFGMFIAAVKETKQQVLLALISGSGLLITGGMLLLLDFDRFFHDYGQQGWGAVLAFFGFILLWGLLFLGLGRLWPRRWKTGFLALMSRRLTVIYFLQWILIGWSFLLIPYHSLNWGQSMVMFLLVTVLSCLGARVYEKLYPKKKGSEAAVQEKV